ncbi:MAG: hypothetical protein WCJ57_03280 [Candidatus Falkowbacteria bacterium]
MPIKKVVPAKTKKSKAVKAPVVKVKKLVVESEGRVNFPVKTFVFVSIVVFVFFSLFLFWWGYLTSSNYSLTDSNSWIYSRHKFDQYRADNCGGDPLVTMPQCSRVQ